MKPLEEIEKTGINILVVEDSETQALRLKWALERKGFTVALARNGAEGLAMMREKKPALIISDILMPVMDGYEMCAVIKQTEEFRDIPIILLTRMSEPADILRGLEAGADNYVTKPFDEDHLVSKVRALLESSIQMRNKPKEECIEVLYADKLYVIKTGRVQTLMFLFSTYENVIWQNIELGRAQTQLKALNENLEKLVERRTDDLREINADLSREILEHRLAKDKIDELNKELQDKIVRLETINKELESFSYSLAHDLRAPARVIDGFSNIMLRDHANDLDEDNKKFLGIIRKNTRKMETLIDDLLNLARLERCEMNLLDIDMGELAAAVFNDIKASMPDCKARFTVKELPAARGERTLIRQVFVNLLANAVKFTRPREKAAIEAGGWSDANENVYYVKDNGVGFDSRYSDRLFGLFKRLHGEEEFEGTGAGLAIIRSIIQRHKGRVWADGKVGEGATFYFTLPRKSEALCRSSS
ncbi:MAG: response regulator [Deltaproteobacteria bacterium]|nr:response regulator [Deltaproteobacteria bacterium]